jgi:hypothetical protein
VPLASDRTAATIQTLPAPGKYLCGLTWDGTHLWHSDQEASQVYAVERADGCVVRQFVCRSVRADLAFDGVHLCQIGERPKRLVLVDRDSGATVGTRPIDPPSGRATGAELAPEGLWLLLRGPSVVQLRDYPAMTVRREYAVPGDSPSGLTYADGVLACGDFEAGVVHALDARTGHLLACARLEGHPTGMTWDGEHLWYCDFPARALRAIDLDDVLP